MPRYIILVRNIHNKNRVNWKKSGELWATRWRDAMKEAREYQSDLNDGLPEDWVKKKDPYYTAIPVFWGDAVEKFNKTSKWEKFKALSQKRVTKQPTLMEAIRRERQPLDIYKGQ